MLRKLLMAGCLAISLMVLPGCGGTAFDKGHKILSISKTTVESVASSAKRMHEAGLMSDEDLEKVRQAYIQVKTSQRIVIDSYIKALDAGQDPQDNDVYLDAIDIVTNASLRFTNLAIQLGLIKE